MYKQTTGRDVMKNYTGQDTKGCYASEKYDGVQGQWDGKVMKTRTGSIINLPAFLMAKLPKTKLTGELWAGRGKFDQVSAIVRKARATDAEWEGIKFMVFDGATPIDNDFVTTVEQMLIWSNKDMENYYKHVIKAGGEGIVITNGNGWTVKKKPFTDQDAEVIGYVKGTGRNQGLTGSLTVKLKNGQAFNLGGLTDALRKNPPKIGSIVKFRYEGETSTGLPRFAKFTGIRAEETIPESDERPVITNTWRPGDKGTKKLMEKYPNLIAVRRYRMPDGTIKKTVEIEIE
jgi:DNA ligase 1